ncbi:MAG: protein kinase [Sandaracinaceae bacterium]|nr:protein kinase [Sandaracinaceae bacterium]
MLPDPRIGQIVQERYRIVRKLGEGGMGAVYEGEHLLIRRRVAIKCLHPQLASSPAVVKRFHNEAIAATSIGHPNIVEVTDMGRFEDGTFYMVLEFLEGRDFDDLIGSEGRPAHRARGAHPLAGLRRAARGPRQGDRAPRPEAGEHLP